MDDLQARIANLSAEQQALLKQRLASRGLGHLAHRVPAGQGLTKIYPTSMHQERLWVFQQLEPNNPVHNLSNAYTLTGPLHKEALERALNEIVRRHEMLRTTFDISEYRPIQVVAPAYVFELPFIDLSAGPVETREDDAARVAQHEASIPCDLYRGPVFRTVLLKTDEEEHRLLITMHHIATDWWSYRIFVEELAKLYSAYARGLPSPLTELPMQFGEYAQWQRDWLSGERLEKLLAFWKQQLAGVPEVIRLPLDRARPAVRSFRGQTMSMQFSQELLNGLRTFRHERVTLFMTLLAAFNVLLYRYGQHPDILVATPSANRERPGTEGLIAYFMNMLMLRTDLSGNPTFRELLHRVRRVALDAFTHQDLPFGSLLQALNLKRDLKHMPLFQVMFIFLISQTTEEELPGLVDTQKIETQTEEFDLTLSLWEKSDGIVGRFEYNSDIFDDVTIERMIVHFRSLLEAVVADPDCPIDALLIHSEESPTVTSNSPSSLLRVHELFESQARHTPNALAVVAGSHHVRFSELNEQANRLAQLLIQQGAGPGDVVAIYLERSHMMIVAMLAILKSGAAYLPIEPASPLDRLAFMLTDANVYLTITEHALLGQLGTYERDPIIIDHIEARPLDETSSNPNVRVRSDDLAYVIYTSGSTGQPKAVQITHHNVMHLVQNAINAYEITSNDRVLQFASFGFDVSVEELFTSLASGAPCYLRSDSMLESEADFLHMCDEWQITVLNLPTSYWRRLTTAMANQGLPLPNSVRLVIIGGEAASVEILTVWHNLVPHRVKLLNAYGPTETTVTATLANLTQERATPIGVPLQGVQTYVLDRFGQQVPSGFPGELFIGGAGVGRGYLGRPGMTAKQFVPNPFSFSSGDRMYRTGDSVRVRGDGQLEYLGRLDEQVKLRGYRIELREIETVLLEHPGVHEATVLLISGEELIAHLVAYVASADASGVNASVLRAHLRRRLPDYMIPAQVLIMPGLPHAPSGKVDRTRLPSINYATAPEELSNPPANAVEELLCNIWSEVLKREIVGVDDNFFELGGDSIQAIQIVAKASHVGLQLTPKQVFQHQTIRELATTATFVLGGRAEQEPVVGETELTPIQRWFFDLPLQQRQHWNWARMLEVRQPLEHAALFAAVRALLQHHDVLRTRFQRGDTGWQARIIPDDHKALLETHDLSSLDTTAQLRFLNERVERLQASLDLEQGPLLQMAYFQLDTNRPGKLFVAVHHLVMDAISWTILVDHLSTAYRQASVGAPIHLPYKTSSYREWAARLAEHSATASVLRELPYWMATLDSDTASLPLDDHALTGANIVSSEHSIYVSLSAERSSALLALHQAHLPTTLLALLLTGLAQAMYAWTGVSSHCIGLAGHGREDIFDGCDVSQTVGWFTTNYPFLLNTTGADSAVESYQRISAALNAVPLHGLNFGILRYSTPQGAEVLSTFNPQLNFNFLGRIDASGHASSLFATLNQPCGYMRSPTDLRIHVVGIDCALVDGQFRARFDYSDQMHSAATITHLAEHFSQALGDLIEVFHRGQSLST